MRKQIFFTLLLVVSRVLFAWSQTNDFYDDAETMMLPAINLEIAGEVANPGKVDLSSLPLRSVIVKETELLDKGDKFIGAYRYDGYSLYDILNLTVLKKKNEAEFPPIIDLYVEIENAKGEKAVLSWGEIYYPIHRHEILVATRVARIVPSKTKDLWPLPTESRLIVASDLHTQRNISNPVKITVKSFEGSFTINKGMKPMYAKSFSLTSKKGLHSEVSSYPAGLNLLTFPAVFYGRGTGIHGTTPFTGIMLKELLDDYFPTSVENLQNGIFVLTGKDGYHAVFTFSEVMNRNDQAEVLVVKTPENEDGGAFKIFPSADFFSDRAIKSLESIQFRILD